MTASEHGITTTLRRLVIPVYLPMGAGALGIGMLVPALPLYLREEGLSFSVVSVVLGAAGLGSMFGGFPSGSILARFNEQILLAIALVAMSVSTILLGMTTAVVALVTFRFVYGMGSIGLRLSRQTFIGNTVPPRLRGRAMALVGGSFRISLLVGPLLGGFLVDSVGFRTTFLICGLLNVVGLFGSASRRRTETSDGPGVMPLSLPRALWQHRSILIKGGFAPALAVAVRDGRYVIIPLFALELGLSPSGVGALVALGNAADFLLFPIAGFLMDRYGRLHAIVPSFSLITVGLVILSTANSALVVGIAGIVMGIGNGIGSGTMLTLATDLAPQEARGQVLSGLAILQDFGTLLGPLIVGITADAAGLGTSALALAGVMVVAILRFVFIVGETRYL